MFSSRNTVDDIVLAVYKENRTVFRLNDIALLVGETNFQSLNKRLETIRLLKFYMDFPIQNLE